MKTKVFLVLVVFILSIFSAVFLSACRSDHKIDVEKYRENAKKSKKERMPTEQRDEIQKSIFPNIDQK